MNFYEQNYRALIRNILDFGHKKEGRNGATRSLFGQTLTIRLQGGFPLLTGRKMYPTGIFGELSCFVHGEELLTEYKKAGCNYWDANAAQWDENKGKPDNEVSIGQYVGSLWRAFYAYDEVLSDFNADRDQLRMIQQQLRVNPLSRRHVLAAWHPGAKSCLPPCTVMAIFESDGKTLNCHVTQRSADLCLGVPSDVAQYALLVHLLARDAGLLSGNLMFTFVDAHIYEAHMEPLTEYMRSKFYMLPRLRFKEEDNFFDALTFEPEDAWLENYTHGPAIKFPFVV